MSVTVPSSVPAAALRAWYDEHLVDNVVLYDLTAQAATSLSALIIKRRRDANGDLEREHWSARLRLVKQQQAALNPSDRAGLIAQQQAWLEESDALAAVAKSA